MILSSLPKPKILYVYQLLPILAVIFAVIICILIWAKYSAVPVETVPVKLIGKKKMPIHGLRFYLCLQFLTDDEKLIEVFADSELQYDSYYEGDTGTLTHKGTKMIKFERTHINPPN